MDGKSAALLTSLVAAAAVVAAPGHARADAWGPDVAPGVLYYTDNAMLTACAQPGFAPYLNVAEYAMDNIDDTTDLDHITVIGDCEFPETDIWWWSVDLPAGVRGRATCRLPHTATICGSDNIEMDFPELDVGSFDVEDRRKTACHELGHAVGLQHNTADSTSSCMISGEVPNPNVQFRQYSPHHINTHINARY